MVLSEDLIESLKCCVYKHDHIVEDAILLSCGGNVCEKCIHFANKNEIKCNYCKTDHDLSSDTFKMQQNPIMKTLVKTYLNDLVEILRNDFNETLKSIQVSTIESSIDTNIDFVEYDIDLRIESLKSQLDQIANDLRKQLHELRGKIKKMIPQEKLTSLGKFIKNLFDNFKTDYESFYNHQTKLREFQFEIKQILGAIPKISFECEEDYLKETIVGNLSCSFPNTHYLVKSSGTHEIFLSKNLCRMQYLKSQDKIILTDSSNKCLKLVDINDGHLIQSTFKPNDDENLLKHPYSICLNKNNNEILVSDIELSKIFIFNENMKLLRTLSDSLINKPNSIRVDIDNKLYISDYENNLISIWESENCNFVKKFQVDSPAYIELNQTKLFVLNTTLSIEGIEFNKRNVLDCIFIFKKESPYELLQTIKYDNWQTPFGLFSRKDFIFTIAHESNNYASVKTNHLYLFIFNKYGHCMQKTKLNQQEAVSDVLIVGDRIFLCYKNFIKILSIQ